jgi:glycosyltransferase involved in cell wall biosynthesis
MASLPSSAVELGFQKSDALTVVSRFDDEFAKARNYQPSDRILAIDNPLEESWLGQNVNLEREQIVGFVGTWLTGKGADLLPCVLLDVLRQAPSSRFLLVGVGDAARASIRKEFPDESKVEIIGSCPRDELRYHYSRMAVLLAPSIYESFGLVFAEGMACGAALVSTPVGFAAGLKDGIEFAKINNRNSEEIASTVCSLLSDEPRRKKIALAGYQRVQALVWGDAVDRLETFYRQLLINASS